MKEENKYYVYVYCDSRKKGNYSYMENGVGVDFDYAPFYIGKGCDLRLLDHVQESKKYLDLIEDKPIQDKNIKINWHKINIINKIIRGGNDVIIYKILDNLSEETSYIVERFLIKLIGRLNKKLGILVNMTDGGEGISGLSDESLERKIQNYKITLRNAPEINIRRVENRRTTEKNDPSINIKRKESRSKTLKDNPEIQKNWGILGSETRKNNPEININAGLKQKETKKSNPQIIENQIKNFKITLKNDPEIQKNWGIRGSKTKSDNPEICICAGKKISNILIINKSANGIKNSRYMDLDISLLLGLYFSFKSRDDISNEYEKVNGIYIFLSHY